MVFDGSAEEGISVYLRSLGTEANIRGVNDKDRRNRTSGDVRFTNVASFDESGRPTWQVRTGGTIKLRFAYEVVETVPSLMFLIQIRSAINGEPLTYIRETISEKAVERGRSGIAELVFPNLPLRPNELSLYVALGRTDAYVFYDIIDDNVDLPFLRVTSDSDDRYERSGIVSIPYRFSARDTDKAEAVSLIGTEGAR